MLFKIGPTKKKWLSYGRRKKRKRTLRFKISARQPGTEYPQTPTGRRPQTNVPTPDSGIAVPSSNRGRPLRIGPIENTIRNHNPTPEYIRHILRFRGHPLYSYYRDQILNSEANRQHQGASTEQPIRRQLTYEEPVASSSNEDDRSSIKRKGEEADKSGKRPQGGLAIGHCGPGNSIGASSGPVDKACQEHDIAYGEMGKEAYFKFSDADQVLIDEMSKQPGIGPKLIASAFRAKKLIAPKMASRNNRLHFTKNDFYNKKKGFYKSRPIQEWYQRNTFIDKSSSNVKIVKHNYHKRPVETDLPSSKIVKINHEEF